MLVVPVLDETVSEPYACSVFERWYSSLSRVWLADGAFDFTLGLTGLQDLLLALVLLPATTLCHAGRVFSAWASFTPVPTPCHGGLVFDRELITYLFQYNDVSVGPAEQGG